MKLELIPEWWVFAIALAGMVLLVYWDYQSRPKRWRLGRLLSITLIMISLLGLYARPYTSTASEEVKIALVTESENSVDTDSLVLEGYLILEDLDEYLSLSARSNISNLVILGDGLERWELEKLRHPITYMEPENLIEGPLDMHIPEASTNTISSLTFRLSLLDSANILLTGSGISTTRKQLLAGDQNITFEVNPQIAGDLTYRLIGLRTGDTLFSELVPISVKPRKRFNTLILINSPSFEIRFLKNLLKQEGFGVVERIQITKDNFRESFDNLDRRSLSRLTKNSLKDFKILITDKDSNSQLSYAEKENVNEALKKGVLGVVWMDSDRNPWVDMNSTQSGNINLKVGQQTVELPTRGVTSRGFERQISVQNKVIGHVHQVGLGRVMLPFLSSTYPLKLKGHDVLYSQLWNDLMQAVVGNEIETRQYVRHTFTRVDEPTTFTFQLADTANVFLESVRLSVEEKWHQPGVFRALAWPKYRGWNQLQIGEMEQPVFVFGNQDWSARKIWKKRIQTSNYAQSKVNEPISPILVAQPISKWIFFAFIVIAISFLWIEQRVN
ncbi:MAG: hypothetical protein JXR10_04035 [Cyclobacteriaceae bacterium]